MRLSNIFRKFFNSEKSAGLVLLACTCASLLLANSGVGSDYINFWNKDINGHSITHWVNDGLMAIFFLLIGLELEREVYIGELSNVKTALLPGIAALGGVLVPAGIYMAFNYGTPTQGGAGIPMATDIAFAIGILSLLGKKVPSSLKVFLTALAVIDDLCAILVIAVFYSGGLSITHLLIALGIYVVLIILGRKKVYNIIPYIIGGVAMWYFMLKSGVHATITGVLLAFAIPFGKGGKKSMSYKLQNFLHAPVAYFILPVFALANTAIKIEGSLAETMAQHYSMGIMLGLLVGKPLGIFLFSFLSEKLKLTTLPEDVDWKLIIATGFLGGIGFTMSIFITLLAFNDEETINHAKIIILLSSLIAGIIGYGLLKWILKKRQDVIDEGEEDEEEDIIQEIA